MSEQNFLSTSASYARQDTRKLLLEYVPFNVTIERDELLACVQFEFNLLNSTIVLRHIAETLDSRRPNSLCPGPGHVLRMLSYALTHYPKPEHTAFLADILDVSGRTCRSEITGAYTNPIIDRMPNAYNTPYWQEAAPEYRQLVYMSSRPWEYIR